MCNGLETAGVTTEASLFSWLALRATMSVDAIWIVTLQSKATRCHACNSRKDMKLLSGQFPIMVMVTVLLIGTFSEEKVIVAQL